MASEGGAQQPPQYMRPGTLPSNPTPFADASGADHPDQVMRKAPRQMHTWTPCPGTAFNVREVDYSAQGKKSQSMEALYEVFAVDAYAGSSKLPHIGRVVQLPEDPDPLPADCGLPPYVIMNWMLPNYAPPGLMQAKRTNGPGWQVVAYARLSDRIRSALREGTPLPAAAQLIRKFMDPTEGIRLRADRLKMIVGVADVDECGFGMMTKQLVCRYNFKPFLSKTASNFYLEPGKYFEIDVDIHTWGNASLTGFNQVKGRLSAMMLRAGVVIEGVDNSELPEQMLSSLYLTQPDNARAATIDPALVQFLNDPSNFVAPLPKS